MSKKPHETASDFNWPPPDEELAQWFDSATSHEEFAAPEASGGEWTTQIEHLQALLDALTAKLEWRTNVSRRDTQGDSHA